MRSLTLFLVRKLFRKPDQLRIPKSELNYFEKAIKGINWNDLLSYTDVEADSQVFLSTIQTTVNGFLKKIKSKPGQKSLFLG